MSHSLANVQSEFANALRYQNNGEHCDIVSDHFTDGQRIQIYRNNFVISLSEVLAATYPLTEMLVGEECFQQMARLHVLSYPSTSGDVSG
ncbi:DNA-binding domain-containing protein, partial [Vibrio splendidus]